MVNVSYKGSVMSLTFRFSYDQNSHVHNNILFATSSEETANKEDCQQMSLVFY